MASTNVESLDVVIIGAGISGINTAYRVQSQLPGAKFTVLEARDNIGGTWDLFRYPGIRSDSDLHTFGFAWHPWPYPNPIAEGPLILSYLNEAITTHGIDKHINLNHKVTAAEWSSKKKKWTVSVSGPGGQTKTYEATFVVLGCGYYDYGAPLQAHIPGLDDFKGRVIHPQYWPADFDHTDKNIVIIGSGATAVTILPAMAKTAKHVTMVQRSPSWVVSMDNRAPGSRWTKFLPRFLADWIGWLYFTIFPHIRVLMCLYWPESVRKDILAATKAQLPERISVDPHFTPRYNPWEQRLCLAPDGDFYKAFNDDAETGEPSRADVVTGVIKTITEDGLVTEDGQTLHGVDAIVTATGLRVAWGGQIPLRVDGDLVKAADKRIWNGCMLNDVPNLVFMMGYTRASWTLGADCSAFILCRLVVAMRKQHAGVAVPRIQPAKSYSGRGSSSGKQEPLLEFEGDGHVESMEKRPWLDLTSSYVRAGEDRLPWYGTKGPWKARGNIWVDWIHARVGNITSGIELSR